MDEQLFADKQLNKQIDSDPNSMVAEQIREERVTNILQQINPDNLLTDIEHRIRGEKKDINGGTWTRMSTQGNEVSELLVSNFISFLGCILNQNTSMSNFKEGEINNMMEMITDWVRNDLVVNAEVYGIEGQYTEYDRVGHIICATCFAVFKRAQNGREAARIFKMMRMSESIGQESKSKLKDLKFW